MTTDQLFAVIVGVVVVTAFASCISAFVIWLVSRKDVQDSERLTDAA